ASPETSPSPASPETSSSPASPETSPSPASPETSSSPASPATSPSPASPETSTSPPSPSLKPAARWPPSRTSGGTPGARPTQRIGQGSQKTPGSKPSQTSAGPAKSVLPGKPSEPFRQGKGPIPDELFPPKRFNMFYFGGKKDDWTKTKNWAYLDPKYVKWSDKGDYNKYRPEYARLHEEQQRRWMAEKPVQGEPRRWGMKWIGPPGGDKNSRDNWAVFNPSLMDWSEKTPRSKALQQQYFDYQQRKMACQYKPPTTGNEL
ncbi:hypothetical protein H632_c3083p0, partial [Helicosporidium sp. ATCC 50920]